MLVQKLHKLARMVKTFLSSYLFVQPWTSVTNSWLQFKYPNPESLHVNRVDIIDRKFDQETGSLIVRRLISASLSPPHWMKSIGFPEAAHILEEAVINPFKKEMVIRSVNIPGNQLLEINEICTYSQDRDNEEENSTKYEQRAVIESTVPFLRSPIESYALSVHETNAQKGLNAMKQICSVCEEIGTVGLRQILRWRLDTILLLNELHLNGKQLKSAWWE